MAVTLAIFGVAFAAFCIWLTVRIVNRREKWAKWTMVSLIALPVLYVASFGPWLWLSEHDYFGLLDLDQRVDINDAIDTVFHPLGWARRHSRMSRSVIDWYARLWIDDYDPDPRAMM